MRYVTVAALVIVFCSCAPPLAKADESAPAPTPFTTSGPFCVTSAGETVNCVCSAFGDTAGCKAPPGVEVVGLRLGGPPADPSSLTPIAVGALLAAAGLAALFIARRLPASAPAGRTGRASARR